MSRLRLAAFVALLLPAMTLAQARPSSTQTAGRYTAAGLAAQEKGDFATAITLFQKAFDLVPHPVLLFNLAQAHRLAGRDAEALALYQRYLAAEPEGARAHTARAHMAALESRLATEAGARAEKAKREAADAEQTAQQRAREEVAVPVSPPRASSAPSIEAEASSDSHAPSGGVRCD